jgi:hypothetical protein
MTARANIGPCREKAQLIAYAPSQISQSFPQADESGRCVFLRYARMRHGKNKMWRVTLRRKIRHGPEEEYAKGTV